jgi:hypothetical protein
MPDLSMFFPAAYVYPVGAGGHFSGGRSSGYQRVKAATLKFLNPEASGRRAGVLKKMFMGTLFC